MQQYLSDNIIFKDPDRFLRGRSIIIDAGCGAGKTTAALNLARSPYMSGKKTLYISTRRTDVTKLRTKTKTDDNIDIISVQALEEKIAAGDIQPADYMAPYGLVVMDEAHYYTTDCKFSETTEISYQALRWYCDNIGNNTLLLISATPDRLTDLFPGAHTIRAGKRTDYIDSITYVPQVDYAEHIIRLIIDGARTGDKGIVYVRSKKTISAITAGLPDSLKGKVEVYTANTQQPECDARGEYHIGKDSLAIISTSVLAFGLDFWDESIKWIATDDTDPLLAVQELGRKRCKDGEKVKYIIADYPNEYLIGTCYKAYADKISEADAYFRDARQFYSAGGQWHERFVQTNNIFRIARHTGYIIRSESYYTMCKRQAALIDKLQGGDTWHDIIADTIGGYIQIVDYHDMITGQVKAACEKYLNGSDEICLMADDIANIGYTTRQRNNGKAKGNTGNGRDFLKRPGPLSKILRPMGYEFGPRKQCRQGGKVIGVYPLRRVNS